MKILTLIVALSVFSAAATAQEQKRHYVVTDLGTLPGGMSSQATFVDNQGVVTGFSIDADGIEHAVLWYNGAITDVAKQEPSGQNSAAFGANVLGQALVLGEISTPDPNNENFCAYATGRECRPFLWQFGVTRQLPLLGGNNGTVAMINNRGEAVGAAENGIADPGCTLGVTNGTGPQVLDYEPVVWGPGPSEVQELRPLDGDTVGMAFWINDNGQAVGISGVCGNTLLPSPAAGPHAVLWENGTVTDLKSLGGTVNPAAFGVGNAAYSINNQGQVSGISALPGNEHGHAFLWTRKTGMRDLGALSGDVQSAGLSINNEGEVVGPSLDEDGNPTAYVWRNGAMSDLNSLVIGESPLYLLLAAGNNDAGQIVGFGVDADGNLRAFLATPREPREGDGAHQREKFHVSEYTRRLIEKCIWRNYPAGAFR